MTATIVHRLLIHHMIAASVGMLDAPGAELGSSAQAASGPKVTQHTKTGICGAI